MTDKGVRCHRKAPMELPAPKTRLVRFEHLSDAFPERPCLYTWTAMLDRTVLEWGQDFFSSSRLMPELQLTVYEHKPIGDV